ncbi:MAG: HigA family addiction module antitoxin [Inquilinaceae bacterium]
MITVQNYKTPGQLIEALLDERGWTKRTLAVVLDIDESKVNRLTTNRQPITASMAVLLEEVFEIPAERFLALQHEYDLAVARIESRPDPERSTRAAIYGDLPIAEMIKRGWIEAENIKDREAVERSLQRFFGVNDLRNIEFLPHAAKRTEVSEIATPTQLAWIYRVRQIASEMLVAPFSDRSLDLAIKKFSDLLRSAEEARHVPRIMAEAGIRFLIVETLPGAKIDGVCFWLDDKSPVIALTNRFDRIDNFWFVLRHEIEHVKRKHGLNRVMLDVDLTGQKASQSDLISEEERDANEAAAEFCIPKMMMDAFIRKKAPFFAERDLRGFAKTIQVHPGLVAGQLQFRTDDYRRFRNHLVPIRSIVAPNAVVDGWGDVYPTE